MLTASRSGDVRLAKWSEIDLEAQTWTIPVDGMKAQCEHRILLSRRALEVLKDGHILANASGFVFPRGRYSRPLTDNTLPKILRDLKVEAVPHSEIGQQNVTA